jgi:hypothetical protein
MANLPPSAAAANVNAGRDRREHVFLQGSSAHRGGRARFISATARGRKIHIHFCPECGTSVYWRADFLPKHIGVAYGAFADPLLPSPTLSAWEQSRHPWIAFDHPLERFQQAVVKTAGD